MFGRRAWYQTHPDDKLPWLYAVNNSHYEDVYPYGKFF